MIGSITSDIFVALIVLGLIIVIHEFGHFAMAKLFKIKVETFSVGFGPRLVGFRRGETDYRISALPLGGYVKMSGENPGDSVTGDPREFLSKPKWQRFLVASAGPAMNIVLAFVLLTGLLMYGTEVPEFFNNEAVVGIVSPDSPAQQAGIQLHDRIVMMDGKEKPNWQDIGLIIGTNPSRPVATVLNRNGQRIETTITPKLDERMGTGEAGMGPLVRTIIREIRPGYPAEAAGLKTNDEITAVNGIDLRTNGKSIQETIQSVPEATFPITVVRDTQPMDIPVTPIEEGGKRLIGITVQMPTVLIKLGFSDAVAKSVQLNSENAVLIFQVLGRLFRREASLRQLDGPIGIVRASGQAAEVGMAALITLTAAISLNLGLVNLLPIPILDGGVMLLLIIEFLMGRDLSLRIKERIVQVSMVFLLLMMVVVLYNDVLKLMPAVVSRAMKVFSPEMQVFVEYLGLHKLKLTPHRELILDTFIENEGHRSVDDIYHVVRQKDPRVGYTTVYRTMKLLVDCGLAREVDLADGITRYEHLYNHEHHDHMICMQCGSSIEFYNAEIEAVQDAASEQLGFRVLDHKLQIYGICKACNKGL